MGRRSRRCVFRSLRLPIGLAVDVIVQPGIRAQRCMGVHAFVPDAVRPRRSLDLSSNGGTRPDTHNSDCTDRNCERTDLAHLPLSLRRFDAASTPKIATGESVSQTSAGQSSSSSLGVRGHIPDLTGRRCGRSRRTAKSRSRRPEPQSRTEPKFWRLPVTRAERSYRKRAFLHRFEFPRFPRYSPERRLRPARSNGRRFVKTRRPG